MKPYSKDTMKTQQYSKFLRLRNPLKRMGRKTTSWSKGGGKSEAKTQALLRLSSDLRKAGRPHMKRKDADALDGLGERFRRGVRGVERADRSSMRKLVITAGVIPPVASTGVGVGATVALAPKASQSPTINAKKYAGNDFYSPFPGDMDKLLNDRVFIRDKRNPGLLRAKRLKPPVPAKSLLHRGVDKAWQGGVAAVKKTGLTVGRVATGSISAGLGMGTMLAMKGIIDGLQQGAPRWVPDIKTDVELIPTYSRVIQPLMYAMPNDEIHMVNEVQSHMRNLKDVPAKALLTVRERIKASLADIKSKTARGLLMFWLGMITAEIAGRGIGRALAPSTSTSPNNYSRDGNGDEDIDLYELAEDEAQYFLPAVAAIGARLLPIAGKVGSALGRMGISFRNGTKAAFLATSKATQMGRAAVPKVQGGITQPKAPFFGKGRRSKLRRRNFTGKANLALGAAFVPSMIHQAHTENKANKQMNQWNDMVSRSGVADRTPPAWDSYSLNSRVAAERHRAAMRMTKKAPPVPISELLGEATPRFRREAIKQKRPWSKLKLSKTKIALLSGLALAGAGTGTGIAMANRKKNPQRYARPTFGAARVLLDGFVTGISKVPLKENQQNKIVGLARDTFLGLNTAIKTDAAAVARKAHTQGLVKGRNQMIKEMTGASSPWPSKFTQPVTQTMSTPHDLRNKLIATGVGSVGGAGAGAVSGRQLGKHEERARIRKLTDMEPI